MKTIDFSYFIERYIAGEMDETEKQWFIREMEGNMKLRHEVGIRKKTEEILKKQDVMDLRDKLLAIEKTREAKAAASRKSRTLFIRYAAVIAVLVTIGTITLIPGKKLGTDEIMDRYYKLYEPATSLRSEKNDDNSDFNLALEYYEVHDYRNAAIYFNKALEYSPANMHSILLHGISNFELKNYPEAKKSFVKVIDNNRNLYIDHAQWYLALCYIQTNEISKAEELLAVIQKSGSIYRKDAKKLLRSL